MLPPLLFVILAGAVVACGSTAGPSAEARPRVDNSRMDTTHLRGRGYGSVYDAISAQHPDWFLARGGPTNSTQAPAVGVFLEGTMRPREVSYLRELRPEEVKLVRRLSPTESLHTYSWPWGALVITLR